MKLIQIFCGYLVGSALALSAAEGSRAYFKLDVGVSLPEQTTIKEVPPNFLGGNNTVLVGQTEKMKFDPGARFDLAGGFNILPSLALEIQTGVLYNSIQDLRLITAETSFGPGFVSTRIVESDLGYFQIPILANVVYTLPLKSRFKPFIGGGAGGVYSIIVGAVDTNDLESRDDFTFAYQGIGGFVFALSDNFDFGLNYKYLGTMDHDFDGFKTKEVNTHSIMATFRFNF